MTDQISFDDFLKVDIHALDSAPEPRPPHSASLQNESATSLLPRIDICD
jgi:hypothetical protein